MYLPNKQIYFNTVNYDFGLKIVQTFIKSLTQFSLLSYYEYRY
jgi:hypothetical protein